MNTENCKKIRSCITTMHDLVDGMIDDDMINMAIANPLGFATEGLVRFMIPKVITNTITGVEETFSAFMPSLLTKLSTWGEE